MDENTLKKIAEALSPGALAFKLRDDGTLSVITAQGRHAFFSAEEVQQAAQEVARRRVKNRHKPKTASPPKRGTPRKAQAKGAKPQQANGEGKPFVCPRCKRSFATKRGLEVHQRYCKR